MCSAFTTRLILQFPKHMPQHGSPSDKRASQQNRMDEEEAPAQRPAAQTGHTHFLFTSHDRQCRTDGPVTQSLGIVTRMSSACIPGAAVCREAHFVNGGRGGASDSFTLGFGGGGRKKGGGGMEDEEGRRRKERTETKDRPKDGEQRGRRVLPHGRSDPHGRESTGEATNLQSESTAAFTHSP